jgi:GNAT superfamily N-acetyltransferase
MSDPHTTMSSTTRASDAPIAPVHIEFAAPGDIPTILMLIRELADFERLSDQVIATEDRLRESLFGTHPSAEVLMARVGAESVGFALFFHNYSTFRAQPGIYLEDLYVRPAYRGQGYGEALLRRLAMLAVQRGCGRFEWSVLDWNVRAIDFYKALGAEPLDDWTMFRVSGDNLRKLAQS